MDRKNAERHIEACLRGIPTNLVLAVKAASDNNGILVQWKKVNADKPSQMTIHLGTEAAAEHGRKFLETKIGSIASHENKRPNPSF